ncbi:16007_t:CDS:1, partial [Dentiscutata heterogama]
MVPFESEREIMPETVNESTPLLSNNETSNRSIIKNPWYKTPSSHWALFLCAANAFSFGLIITSR